MSSGRYSSLLFKAKSRHFWLASERVITDFFKLVRTFLKSVRFIAISNGVDSTQQSSNEFAPFLNIMNEWYVRDTSRKIKSVLHAKGMDGKHTGSFQTDEQEEYAKWNIKTRNGAYYYKNMRIRILMDTRADYSFENLCYDKKGKVDLKIIRDKNNSIKKVQYLSGQEAKTILYDFRH